MMIEEQNRHEFRESNDFRGKFATFIAGIPYKHIAGVGKILGMIWYFLDVRHRRIVRRNLKFVYPEWELGRVKQISKRIFQNMVITIIEISQMTCFSHDNIIGKVKIRGEEHLFNAMHNNKGTILISAHLGNWEMVALFWPLYFKMPITAVDRQIQNRIIDRWIRRLRTRFGNKVIDKGGALPEMTKTLRQNKVLGIFIDQGTKSSLGVKITFFDKFVTATPAAALLALRCKSPVLPVFCTRNEDGTYNINIEPPLALKRTDDLHADLRTNTQIMMDAIERAVQKYPEQWLWVHRRWRKYYPHLYTEEIDWRRRSRDRKKKRAQSRRS
jgi:KDO2-lipid IV(A) lauroyltransferase